MPDETLSPGRIRPCLRAFLPLVDLVAEFFGSNCEVVLHDFSRARGTIVKIRNGHLSGRSVGGPITDYGLQMIRRLRDDPKAPILHLNYISRGKGGRELKSASMIIRQGRRNLGALCINVDLGHLNALRHFIDGFCSVRRGSRDGSDPKEIFVPDFHQLMDEWIDKAIEHEHCIPGMMNRNDKFRILRALDKQGVFLMRGAVREVSRRLGVAAPTIYKNLTEQRHLANSKTGPTGNRRRKKVNS